MELSTSIGRPWRLGTASSRERSLQGYAKGHYTREDIDTLIEAGPVDIPLTHDAPAGVVFARHRMGANRAGEAKGIDELVRAT